MAKDPLYKTEIVTVYGNGTRSVTKVLPTIEGYTPVLNGCLKALNSYTAVSSMYQWDIKYNYNSIEGNNIIYCEWTSNMSSSYGVQFTVLYIKDIIL